MHDHLAKWDIKSEYMTRAQARGDAWVYSITRDDKRWGLFVDEEIRYKTLFKPGGESHPDWDEIIIPLLGRYWVKVGDWSRTLTPGECALIPRGVEHDSGIATNLVGTRFLVILFDRSLNVLKGRNPGGVALPSGANAWLKGAFRFLRHGASLQSFLPLSILPQFIQLVSSGNFLASDHSHADSLVTSIARYLEQSETPSLAWLAEEVKLSVFHLQRRFMTAMGVTPLQYANAWKLDQIASQLNEGNTLPLVELAVEYGFNDMKHFRTLFRRRYGSTPSAYRKNHPSK